MIESTFLKKINTITFSIFFVCFLVLSSLLTSGIIVKPALAAALSVTDSYVDYSKINNGASTNYVVTGGQLKMTLINGAACSTGSQCTSGFCVDGVCCNTACTGSTCQRCDSLSNAGAGTCGYINTQVDPNNECAPSLNACSGNTPIGPDGNCSGTGYSCKTTGNTGSACATASTCKTGGGCSGGSCVPVSNAGAGTDPYGQCTASYNGCSGNNRVGPDGNCNGAGACNTGGLSSGCTTAGTCQTGGSCSGGSCVGISYVPYGQKGPGCSAQHYVCNGSGGCIAPSYQCNPYSCNPYACNCTFCGYNPGYCGVWGNCVNEGYCCDSPDWWCQRTGGGPYCHHGASWSCCQTCYSTCYNTCYYY